MKEGDKRKKKKKNEKRMRKRNRKNERKKLKRKRKRRVKEKEEREKDERNEKRIKKRKKKRIRNQEAVLFLMKFNNFAITICFFLSPYLTERQDTSFSQVNSLLNNVVKIHTHTNKAQYTQLFVFVTYLALSFKKRLLAVLCCQEMYGPTKPNEKERV
jgi:outer membrane biosynthesis protein TonB